MIFGRITSSPPSAEKIIRNLNFGHALGLTQTAKEGQSAVKSSLKNTFIIRNKWPDIGPFSIKIKPATRSDLQSEVFTNAYWLEHHETGRDRRGRGGGRLAVPTENVRRNKRQIIFRSQRPQALRSGGKSFVLRTKRGPVIFQRVGRGKRKKLSALYGLEDSVKIRKRSTFYDPINKVVRRRLTANIVAGVRRALATIK